MSGKNQEKSGNFEVDDKCIHSPYGNICLKQFLKTAKFSSVRVVHS